MAARRNDGFTLIEVLVALAVLAVAMGFAFRAFSSAMVSLDGSERKQTALSVARSMLDRVGRDIALRAGDADGRTADGFVWHLHQAPYDTLFDCVDGIDLQGIVVQVDVGWTSGRRAQSVRLSSLLLSQQAGK
jgi:general secretion pathway protein I